MPPDPTEISRGEPDDVALVRSAAAGDNAAFAALVRRYQGLVWACTRAMTGNDADAGDVAQETFIRFYRYIHQYDPERPLKPYLLRIAANCSRSLLASRRVSEFDRSGAGEAAAPSPEQAILHRERRIAVRESIDRLPPVLRRVCRLFYLADCSCRETGEILGMSEGAVKVALHRARRKLAPLLAQWRQAP